jgi:hypothetical protein
MSGHNQAKRYGLYAFQVSAGEPLAVGENTLVARNGCGMPLNRVAVD